MEPRQNKYISMFKINNVPILPPLMTNEKRHEMRRYRELALALEMKLKLEAGTEINASPEKQEQNELKGETPCEDEYFQLQKLLEEKSEDVMQVLFKKEKALNRNQLKKSDTFIYDIITNTVIMPYDLPHNHDYCRNEYDNHSIDRSKTNKIKAAEMKLPLKTSAKLERCVTSSPRKQSPPRKQFSNSQLPQISVKPPTPEYKITSREPLSRRVAENSVTQSYESHDKRHEDKTSPSGENRQKLPDSRHSSCKAKANNTPTRSTTNPSIATSEIAPRLIRSNSFTLESPSNALLQHLASQGNNSFDSDTKSNLQENASEVLLPSEDSETIKTKVESKTAPDKSKEETSGPKQNRKINTLLITNSTMYKNKRSPYDVKLCGRTKILKKHKNPAVRTVSAISVKHRSRHSSRKSEEKNLDQTNSSDALNVNEMFKGMDETQKQRLLDLIKKQEEEQNRMRDIFEKQQRMLLQELSNSTNSATSDFECSQDLCSKSVESANLKPSEDSSKMSLEQKQESVLSVKSSKSVPYNKIVVTLQNSKEHPRPSPRKKLFLDDQSNKSKERPPTPARRREKAAITLQAYIRGFLVRRLFRTKHVQKLVEIIRDTLLFVLKLHMETRYDNSENNIRLKARLLQQLSSSSQALHKIFFEMPTKERMQIIRKDRLFIAYDSARSPRKQ